MLLLNVRHMARRPVFSAFNRPQSRKGNLLMYVRKDFHKSTGFIQIMDDALARHSDLEAIVYGGWRMTYREFGSCINRAAHMLLALGLGKGSPAAIISRNCPEFLILEFALYKIGAVPVKINWRLSPREMIGQLDASGAGHAFLRAEREDWGRELVGHYGGSLRFFDLSGDRRENSSFMQAIAGYPDEELSVELESSGVSLTYFNYLEDDTVVIADAEQIKRVINNIISNSMKYMDKPKKAINIRLRDVGDFIQIEIEDNGKGIAQKDLANIFDRFYRTDASRNSSKGGSGIGLSIVKKIMEDHGGQVWATSKEGTGTVMYLALRKYQEVPANE